MGMFKSLWGMITGWVRGIPMIECEEALESLFEYLDEEIDAPRRAAIEKHLEICRRCYPRVQFERAFLDVLGGVDAKAAVPADLRDKVFATLKKGGA